MPAFDQIGAGHVTYKDRGICLHDPCAELLQAPVGLVALIIPVLVSASSTT
jgi:hypothetical protein